MMKRLLRLFSKHVLSILTIVMFCAAAYFYVRSVEMKQQLENGNPELFADGDVVTVIKVIDGDEFLAKNAEGYRVVVRLLGIKSFSPTITDPTISQYGKICFNHLQKTLEGQEVTLMMPETKTDSKKRLLSYAFRFDPDKGASVDVGKSLLTRGYSLVYTRYDFSKMDEYLEAEKNASEAPQGLWSNDTIASRARSLKALWLQEKLQDD